MWILPCLFQQTTSSTTWTWAWMSAWTWTRTRTRSWISSTDSPETKKVKRVLMLLFVLSKVLHPWGILCFTTCWCDCLCLTTCWCDCLCFTTCWCDSLFLTTCWCDCLCLTTCWWGCMWVTTCWCGTLYEGCNWLLVLNSILSVLGQALKVIPIGLIFSFTVLFKKYFIFLSLFISHC